MMDPVHGWCHHQPAHRAVKPKRQREVGVGHEREAPKQDLERQQCYRHDAEYDRQRELEGQGQQDLQRMETQCRGRIESGIGVVHSLRRPQALARVIPQVFEQTSPRRRLVVLCGRGIHSRP